MIGTVLGGKYVVEAVLGQGGMGVVVAARHVDLDQRVAIKCLLDETRAVPELVERFMREARAAAKIQGEHVARVLDVGRFEDGTPFMVMEYLHGHDLAKELTDRGPLGVTDAVRYLLETCEAVVQAHALRIVHRDLKPANLFLAQQPGRRAIVKVLDFGISKVIDPSSAALTKTANVMGTPHYMSPEQLLSSKNVDERSDIWALGVILYELLAGDPPFQADSVPEIIARVLQNAPPPLGARRPGLPPGLEAVVARCLRTRPEERYANIAELARDLMPSAAPEQRESVLAIERVLGISTPEGPRALSVPAPNPTPGPAAAGTAHNLTLSSTAVVAGPRRRWGSLAAGSAAAVACVIAGFVGWHRPAAPPSLEPPPPAQPAEATRPAATAVTLAPVDPEPLAPAPNAASPAPAGVSASPAPLAPPAPPSLAGAGVEGVAPASRRHPTPSGLAQSNAHGSPSSLQAPSGAPKPAVSAPPAAAPPTLPPAATLNPLDMHIK